MGSGCSSVMLVYLLSMWNILSVIPCMVQTGHGGPSLSSQLSGSRDDDEYKLEASMIYTACSGAFKDA